MVLFVASINLLLLFDKPLVNRYYFVTTETI